MPLGKYARQRKKLNISQATIRIAKTQMNHFFCNFQDFLKEYFHKCSIIIIFSLHRMKPGFAYIFYPQISHYCWSFNHSKYNKKNIFYKLIPFVKLDIS